MSALPPKADFDAAPMNVPQTSVQSVKLSIPANTICILQVFHEMADIALRHITALIARFSRSGIHRTINSATSAGLSCPSISTVMLHVNCRPPSTSSTFASMKRARTRLPLRTGEVKQNLVKSVVQAQVAERERVLQVGFVEPAEQRQRQEAVRYRAAVRRRLRAFDIDMDPLEVAGRLSERVDTLLIDRDPVGRARPPYRRRCARRSGFSKRMAFSIYRLLGGL